MDASLAVIILRADYFSGGARRWDLGLETPNVAGALVVSLLPILWWLTSLGASKCHGRHLSARAVAMLALVMGEVALTLCLAKTASRGALIALLAALVWWHVINKRQSYGVALARVTLLGLCVWLSGFGERVSPTAMITDRSTLNRLPLYEQGLAMMAQAPISGWGQGRSGLEFMRWFQSEGAPERYLSLANGFLTIGVEHGAMVLWLVVTGLAGLLVTQQTFRAQHRDAEPLNGLLAAATAIIVAYAACNFFSNIIAGKWTWPIPTLAVGAVLLIVGARRIRISLRTWLLLVAGTFGGMILALGLGKMVVQRNGPLQISPLHHGTRLANYTHLDSKVLRLEIWETPDMSTPSMGKALKRWLYRQTQPVEIVLVDKLGDLKPDPVKRELFVFGNLAARLPPRPEERFDSINWIQPDARYIPTITRGAPFRIFVPKIDKTGSNRFWTKWSEANELSISSTVGSIENPDSVWDVLSRVVNGS